MAVLVSVHGVAALFVSVVSPTGECPVFGAGTPASGAVGLFGPGFHVVDLALGDWYVASGPGCIHLIRVARPVVRFR